MIRARKQNGVSMIEVPVMLILILVVLLLPMLTLASVTLRLAFMNAAVQDGAHLASKAKTFQSGTADKPAAVVLADNAIRSTAKKFTGLTIANVSTDIVITPINGGQPIRQSSKLAVPADTSRSIYQIETVAKGEVEPLFQLNEKIFGRIPMLSAPLEVNFAARQMAENPQGLNQ